jgi:putative membrane protein insertion efficiency factor
MNILQKALVGAIRVYQLVVSPVLAAAMGPSGRCRFSPTCSRYAREAIERQGAVAGSVLAARRLCRCHPWGQWGEDPPPVEPIKLRTLLPNIRKSKFCHGS